MISLQTTSLLRIAQQKLARRSVRLGIDLLEDFAAALYAFCDVFA